MKKAKLAKLLTAVILLVFVGCMTNIGCSPKVVYHIPPLGEKAVPKISLPQRPELDQFTEEELGKIPLTAHGKILNYLAESWAYADIAEAAVKELKDYIKDVFSDYNKKKKELTN